MRCLFILGKPQNVHGHSVQNLVEANPSTNVLQVRPHHLLDLRMEILLCSSYTASRWRQLGFQGAASASFLVVIAGGASPPTIVSLVAPAVALVAASAWLATTSVTLRCSRL